MFASAQRAEMYAVVMVLRDFPQQPINLYSDSHYVLGVLRCFETARIGHTSSEELFNLFFQLCSLVRTHLYPCFVSHLCSRSNLPGHSLTVMPGQITWFLGLLTQAATPTEAAQ
jgi:hypothetical protein